MKYKYFNKGEVVYTIWEDMVHNGPTRYVVDSTLNGRYGDDYYLMDGGLVLHYCRLAKTRREAAIQCINRLSHQIDQDNKNIQKLMEEYL